jgi:hypothetical protein
MAAYFKSDWNYGNAIHYANMILGRIALQEGKINRAKEYLLKSGNTPGSPQLKSFGPNMSLAEELLKQGEINVVLEYLELCEKFWWFIFRAKSIRKWRKKIKEGEIPQFRKHLEY